MTQIADININELLKENPVGIDKPIQRLQVALGDNIDWLDKNFGRCFKTENTESRKYTPEIYIGDSEYIDTFPDDLTSMCFFDEADEGRELDYQLYHL